LHTLQAGKLLFVFSEKPSFNCPCGFVQFGKMRCCRHDGLQIHRQEQQQEPAATNPSWLGPQRPDFRKQNAHHAKNTTNVAECAATVTVSAASFRKKQKCNRNSGMRQLQPNSAQQRLVAEKL